MKKRIKQIINGEALESLRSIESDSIDCVATSPPYWQLRDYGVVGQLGLEDTIDEYLDNLILIFAEIKRVLKKDGTCFVNLGDTYGGVKRPNTISRIKDGKDTRNYSGDSNTKRKSLNLIPERFAIKMVESGWYLRNQIIWQKPNVMPESVTDRFTNDFEKVFFFTKSAKYYFKKQYEEQSPNTSKKFKDGIVPTGDKLKRREIKPGATKQAMLKRRPQEKWNAILPKGRNKRTVWNIATRGIKEAHFAVFPEELVSTCLKSGCKDGGVVLDPFFGSGTTGVVAIKQNKGFIGIELNEEYVSIAKKRISKINLRLF